MRTLLSAVSAALPAVLLCAALPCFGLSRAHHTAATHANIKHSAVKLHKAGHATFRHETIGMDSGRATQIQSALIKSGYLSGEPSGVWDSETAGAMQKLQGANGWQTKITPDSRALIKLGLGPQQDQAFAANTH
jgi:hypothetical protein